MSLFSASLGPVLQFEKANLPLELQTALFSSFLVAAIVLMAYLVLMKFPGLADRLRQGLGNWFAGLTGQKREARLNKIVCYHCHKGMGLYDPIYFMVAGEPHIKGTCSLCGGHVEVRLR